MGNYMVTNPSVFNSFENKFKGMWNVGVMVQIPIWHWGEGIYKTRAAKAEARIAQYQLQDAREKIGFGKIKLRTQSETTQSLTNSQSINHNP